MTVQTAIWIPPSLCGCQIRMTADFTDGSVVNGISYKHPIPFTISRIEIVNACEHHLGHTSQMRDTEDLMEIDQYTGNKFQQRGYLKHPINNPSPAECLYEYLCQYRGQTHGFPCGCKTHQFIDPLHPEKKITYLHHPHHHKRCKAHQDDSLDMQKAKFDFHNSTSE